MNKVSFLGFTSWLATLPPEGKYTYSDVHGNCLVGQYMKHIGIDWCGPRVDGNSTFCQVINQEPRLGEVSCGNMEPDVHTYGQALKRATKLLELAEC